LSPQIRREAVPSEIDSVSIACVKTASFCSHRFLTLGEEGDERPVDEMRKKTPLLLRRMPPGSLYQLRKAWSHETRLSECAKVSYCLIYVVVKRLALLLETAPLTAIATRSPDRLHLLNVLQKVLLAEASHNI